MQIGILSDTQHAMLRQAFILANQYVEATVTTECVAEGRTWWDTRPMLDAREHCPATVDVHRQILEFGLEAGLLVRSQVDKHLVRIVPQPQG